MLGRAGYSNELFRFSTTKLHWEQLDASRVSVGANGIRIVNKMGARTSFGNMVVLDNKFYMFGGFMDSGEEGRCDAGRGLGGCQIDHGHCSVRYCCVLWPIMGFRSGVQFRAATL